MTKQTKISRFMKGLKPATKDNLVSIINCLQTLHGWENIIIIIQVDANIHQCEIEKCEELGKKPGKPTTDLSLPSTTMTLPAMPDVVPMEVDTIQTSSAPQGKLTQAKHEYCTLSRGILTHLHSRLYHLKPTTTIPAPPAYIPAFLTRLKSTRTSPHYSA